MASACAAEVETVQATDSGLSGSSVNGFGSIARRNVRILWGAQLFINIVCAYPLGPLFDAYLLETSGGRNAVVGLIESLRGSVVLLSAFPLGILADWISKHRLLQVNGLLGLIFVVFYAVAFTNNSWIALLITIAVWGVHRQANDGTATALLAECTAEGEERAQAIAWLQAFYFAGNAAAPAVQAILIYISGTSTWDPVELKHILLFGLSAELGVCLPYLFLRRQRDFDGVSASGARLVTVANGEQEQVTSWKQEFCFGRRKSVLVPLLLEAAQIMVMFGSGCTVKFLPLFFKHDFGFSPAEVCILMATMNLCVSLYGVTVPLFLARKMGRVRVALATHVMANAALYVFCTLQDWRLALPLWIVRYAAMNSVTQLSAALVMDIVDPGTRGRWAGIVSLKAGIWSGTAALGGILADATGDYRSAFLATAVAHTVAALFLLPVVWLVPRHY